MTTHTSEGQYVQESSSTKLEPKKKEKALLKTSCCVKTRSEKVYSNAEIIFSICSVALDWGVNDILWVLYNLHRSETVKQLESSLKSLSSWCGLSIHKGWWENMKPAGLWYRLFEIFPAALSCWWPSEWNKGLASVFACGKWHLLFLISDVIHVLDSEPSPSHYFGLF